MRQIKNAQIYNKLRTLTWERRWLWQISPKMHLLMILLGKSRNLNLYLNLHFEFCILYLSHYLLAIWLQAAVKQDKDLAKISFVHKWKICRPHNTTKCHKMLEKKHKILQNDTNVCKMRQMIAKSYKLQKGTNPGRNFSEMHLSALLVGLLLLLVGLLPWKKINIW